MNKILLILFSTVMFITCKNIAEDNLIAFEVDGKTRQYMLYIPESLEVNTPLVFVLHGLGSSAAIIRDYSQMDRIAEKNGFVINKYINHSVEGYKTFEYILAKKSIKSSREVSILIISPQPYCIETNSCPLEEGSSFMENPKNLPTPWSLCTK